MVCQDTVCMPNRLQLIRKDVKEIVGTVKMVCQDIVGMQNGSVSDLYILDIKSFQSSSLYMLTMFHTIWAAYPNPRLWIVLGSTAGM